jgi:hypothetical protein
MSRPWRRWSTLSATSPAETLICQSSAAKRGAYADRLLHFCREQQRLAAEVRRLIAGGLVFVATAAGALAAGLEFDVRSDACWLIGVASVIAANFFGWAILKRREDNSFAARMAEVNSRALARFDRDWDRLPVPNVDAPESLRDSSLDLDLFGRASLCHLVSRARTPWGLASVADWIAVPAGSESIRRRQASIKELAPQLDYRQRLEATASFVENIHERSQRFAAWIANRRDERWLTPATWIARVQTLAALVLLALLFISEADRTIAGVILTGIVGANVLISIALLGRIHSLFNVVTEGANDAARYRKLIEAAADFSPTCEQLAGLHGTIFRARRGVRLLDWLARITGLQSLKFAVILIATGPLLFFLYVFLQFVLLWDFHVAWALSCWRRRYGSAVLNALRAIGDVEAIASFAAVADEHPDWCFAQIAVDGPKVLTAEAVGHPLLPDDRCVRNDVSIGPPGTVLVVTGSNMSGKSTLLRAIGTNVVLAQAGAPCCAKSFTMPPLRVATVMRVSDSLESGVSYFMAELLRIRRVVDAAEQLDADPVDRNTTVLLYLLDEILQGTNNAERRIAAANVLSYLATKNAIGAVSTHDLDLVAEPALAPACRAVHFRESFTGNGDGAQMVFDYRMRPGIAPTTNVAFLLKSVGLPCAGFGLKK